MVSSPEDAYLDLMLETVVHGERRGDRTGTGTRSLFARQLEINLAEGFPLLTTKKLYWRGIVEELLWFIRGDTNVRELEERKVNIWSPWADENGELGPIYGRQWRAWRGGDGSVTDQLAEVVEGLMVNPDGRRHLVNAWNVAEIPDMALPPCHVMFQFYARQPGPEEFVRANVRLEAASRVLSDPTLPRRVCEQAGECPQAMHEEMDRLGIPHRVLDCQVYQRSADLFIGVPFNLASYALLTHLVARHLGFLPGRLIWTGGDCHVYENHVEQAAEQLSRCPTGTPRLRWVTDLGDMFRIAYLLRQEEAVEIEEYNPHPMIKAPVAV